MGITTIEARVFNPADLSRYVDLEFIVDSGAGHSVVPRSVLQELGINPHSTKRFYMVDGQGLDRQVGGAAFEYAGERAYAPVIFGEEGRRLHVDGEPDVEPDAGNDAGRRGADGDPVTRHLCRIGAKGRPGRPFARVAVGAEARRRRRAQEDCRHRAIH